MNNISFFMITDIESTRFVWIGFESTYKTGTLHSINIKKIFTDPYFYFETETIAIKKFFCEWWLSGNTGFRINL